MTTARDERHALSIPASFADDTCLVAGLVARDPAAAAAAWDRYAPVVRRLVGRYVGSPHDRDDLVQDVFLHFFRKIDSLREPAAVGSFIVGISIHVSHGELRRRRIRRWLRLTPDGDSPEVLTSGADHDAREALRRAEALVASFDDDIRLAFVLRCVHGLELAETARVLGVSLATIKRRIGKATQILGARVRSDPAVALLLRPYGADDGDRPRARGPRTACPDDADGLLTTVQHT